uniref:CYRIA/CYRIB Rac1 binding domain-containing protein n=1 Tax=Pavo cristatus TaxID=9049 RepID=A0A8C9FT63_PAVCR
MVGVIILYDHVHPVGAFSKTSKIDMKGCIKVLKEQPPDTVEGLLNALRYVWNHCLIQP